MMPVAVRSHNHYLRGSPLEEPPGSSDFSLEADVHLVKSALGGTQKARHTPGFDWKERAYKHRRWVRLILPSFYQNPRYLC